MQSPKWSKIELITKASSGFLFGMLLLKVGSLTSPFTVAGHLIWNIEVTAGSFLTWSIFTTVLYGVHDYTWRRWFNKISG